jgi:hypothetical protein
MPPARAATSAGRTPKLAPNRRNGVRERRCSQGKSSAYVSPMTWMPVNPLTLTPEEIRQHIAVHEAGHAVVGLALGLHLVDVSIGNPDAPPPEPPADSGIVQVVLGRTLWEPEDLASLANDHPHETAVMAMAGVVAEELILHRHGEEGWTRDLEILGVAKGWVSGITPKEPAELGPEVRALVLEAERLVRQHGQWTVDVANDLMLMGWLTGATVLRVGPNLSGEDADDS